MYPSTLVSLQLVMRRERRTTRTQMMQRAESMPMVEDWTETSRPPEMTVSRSHGRPRATRMSKMLLPKALETAMFPWPSRATAMEVRQSAMLVPTASTVAPMMSSGMPRMQPSLVAQPIIIQVSTASHSRQMGNDRAYMCLSRLLAGLGTVYQNSIFQGKNSTASTHSLTPWGRVSNGCTGSCTSWYAWSADCSTAGMPLGEEVEEKPSAASA